MAAPTPPDDAALNTYILTRYALMGIDISVLPADDPTAVMDQRRVLEDARRTVRDDVVAANFPLDPQFHAPALYPAPFLEAWTEDSRG
ncbi:hypothetical protein [Nocardioides marmotae]|uniref:hypothetical protein n=1 Tax=Nocardioides marmotae TaxID=2663857 RepID=UPI001495883D|nr:hypothetical protein [Nocardioides marmotae]QKE00270.1 hypothetical protein HPC71_03635 [Nocardioides marmotae]